VAGRTRRRDELTGADAALAEVLDEYLRRIHGVLSSHQDVDAFTDWLGERGYQVVPTEQPRCDAPLAPGMHVAITNHPIGSTQPIEEVVAEAFGSSRPITPSPARRPITTSPGR